MHKILLIFGTRPEAIKLCPVIRGLANIPAKFDVKGVRHRQHRADVGPGPGSVRR